MRLMVHAAVNLVHIWTDHATCFSELAKKLVARLIASFAKADDWLPNPGLHNFGLNVVVSLFTSKSSVAAF